MDQGRTHLGSLGFSHPQSWFALKGIFNEVLSVWLQPTCFLCGRHTTNGILCGACNHFPPLTPPYCLGCGEPVSYEIKRCGKCKKHPRFFPTSRSSFWLNEAAQKLLHEIKFRGHYPSLNFIIKTQLPVASIPTVPEGTWVVPVPLFKSSHIERGFNQAEILATQIAKSSNLRMVSDALVKVRKTDRQSWLNTKQRKKNLKRAFQWNPRYTAPYSVLLVDDVYTTGSTLLECAHILNRQKVRLVYGWTLFRTPKIERAAF